VSVMKVRWSPVATVLIRHRRTSRFLAGRHMEAGTSELYHRNAGDRSNSHCVVRVSGGGRGWENGGDCCGRE
jgi:hypothetical protein